MWHSQEFSTTFAFGQTISLKYSTQTIENHTKFPLFTQLMYRALLYATDFRSSKIIGQIGFLLVANSDLNSFVFETTAWTKQHGHRSETN